MNIKINPYDMLPKSPEGQTIKPKKNADEIVGQDDIAVMWMKKTDQMNIFVRDVHKVLEWRKDDFNPDAVNGVKIQLAGGNTLTVGFLTLED